jgi:hypothetical protein
MNLWSTQRDEGPIRTYVNGRRVSREAYELILIAARIKGDHQHSFWTQRERRGQGLIVRHGCSITPAPSIIRLFDRSVIEVYPLTELYHAHLISRPNFEAL